MWLFTVISLDGYSQDVSFGIGLNYDIAMDFFSDENYSSTEAERISGISTQIFLELQHNDYHIYPNVIFSVSGGFIDVQNELGAYVPGGQFLEIPTINFPEAEFYTELYDHVNAEGKLSYFMGGGYVTRDMFKGFELGAGVYFMNSEVKIKNFRASDHYHFIERINGVDRLRYVLTLFSEHNEVTFSKSQISFPVVASYLFDLEYFKFKPGLFLFVGEDISLKANLSFSFPLTFLNKAKAEPSAGLNQF